MCGICGIIGCNASDESAAILSRMLGQIVHRGPDEEGKLIAPRFAAGTRRLSIIDLAGGSQPIWNEDKTLGVCFNGEIYNFRELRDQLIASGHRFRTQSDTETIVHAYEQWGTQGFARLHGMFAFVLAELPEGPSGPVKRVTLVRDRFGVKPLYYALNDSCLLFASEVRALLASGVIKAHLSSDGLASYLFFGSVCEPNTLVDGVYSLPPGHFAAIPLDVPTARPEPMHYWDVSSLIRRDAAAFRGENALPGANHNPKDAVSSLLRSHLQQAVQSHLIADVPVGIFLSSGLDSTAIAALAARIHPGIHTFTVAFPDLEFNEGADARSTAERLGTQHSELRLSADEMLARMNEAINAFDQPSMDGINTFFVSWAARQSGLKVALSGVGSDELFGGYPTFRTARAIERLAKLGGFVPAAMRSAAAWSAESMLMGTGSRPAVQKALSAWLEPGSFPHAYFFTRTLFTSRQLAEAVDSARSPNARAWRQWLKESACQARQMDRFTALSWLELRSYMLNTLLRDTDCMSMANSLEVRVPFLDVSLVEHALSLPEVEKLGPYGPKSLLITALADLLPENALQRTGRRKRTFTFPWANWLRGALRARIDAGLADWSSALAPFLSPAFALRVWQDFQQGRTTWSRPWSLYVLNEWTKRHLERARVA